MLPATRVVPTSYGFGLAVVAPGSSIDCQPCGRATDPDPAPAEGSGSLGAAHAVARTSARPRVRDLSTMIDPLSGDGLVRARDRGQVLIGRSSNGIESATVVRVATPAFSRSFRIRSSRSAGVRVRTFRM